MIEFLGYYTYVISEAAQKRVVNLFLNHGLTPCEMQMDGGTVRLRLSVFFSRRLERILEKENIPYQRHRMGGILGGAIHLMRRPGVVLGCLLSVFLYLWFSGMVWEVRVVSRYDVDEDRILSLLSECGLNEGRRLSRIDEDDVVADYLMRDPSIAFAAVHLRGVVAEVEVIPYEVKDEPDVMGEPCNIVASEDALITDITVYAGRALVKVGETVRKGDILVSGVVTDADGMHLVRAVADIKGERSCDISVTSPVSVVKTAVVAQERESLSVTFFGRTFYFGSADEGMCVEEKRRIYLFGKIRLPIVVTQCYRYETFNTEYTLTEQEQRMRAEAMLEEQMEEILGDGALLHYEKHESAGEVGYTIDVHLVFENNIGKSLAFGEEKQ